MDRLVDLIDQLIDLSRFEAGLIKLNPIPSSLRHIINSVAEEMRLKNPDYKFKKNVKGIATQMNIDARRIRQVLDNLLDNAVKYSPPGTLITIGAKKENGDALVWVQDEGYGIPEREKERIFTSLYRVKVTGGDDTGGLGLGLSLCKIVVESHGRPHLGGKKIPIKAARSSSASPLNKRHPAEHPPSPPLPSPQYTMKRT